MAERAALVTGGSSGIGLAIARALGEDGYGVTVSARRPEKLEAAAEELRERGHRRALGARQHGRRGGDRRAGASRTGSGSGDSTCWSTTPGSGSASRSPRSRTKTLDMQLGVNLRAVVVATREALPMLREAGRRARQGADRQHGVDRGQVGPGVAIGLLGDEGGRGRLQPGDAEGGRRPGDPGDGALSRVRRHADDRVRRRSR